MCWFICFAGGDRRIIISAGRLVGASRINPVGSMMVLYAVFVRLVSVIMMCSGRRLVLLRVSPRCARICLSCIGSEGLLCIGSEEI